ncbi:alpha/beta hydrolase [Marinobacter mobilis]|uniref:Acetyl esterase/lipase n=1 Tax=Marinobacter mobilis TaxID=488533 RepID=A0A1H2T2E5_9GAMM|nr:alpha/beta hydrolase [Marinobacter mobilis]SDW37875.1 Acetyl esterase/lipase [Marinobacter mobilis]
MLQSALATGLRQTMLHLVKPVLNPLVPVSLQRMLTRQAYRSSIPPRGCQFENTELGGVPTLKTHYGTGSKHAVLYLHGGAYIIGSAQTHRGITGHLAKSSGATIFTLDYRLAPEHPYPAALDDAMSAYQALLSEGYEPKHIAIAGDSAGGGLSLALAMRLRDEQLPLPSSLTVFSPWTDLSQSELSRPVTEAVIPQPWIDNAAQLYRGNESVTAPYISPIYGDLSGLPPILIQVGSEEILLNDSKRLANKARQQATPVRLEIYNSLWHVFQIHAGQLARASEALHTAGEHIRSNMTL